MRVTAARFQQIMEGVIDAFPEWLAARLDNVSFFVQPWPTAEQHRTLRARPQGMLLGLYQGVPQVRRSGRYHLIPPDRITLFQGPLQMRANDEQELGWLIRRTILHEVGHHLGFSESELRKLGY